MPQKIALLLTRLTMLRSCGNQPVDFTWVKAIIIPKCIPTIHQTFTYSKSRIEMLQKAVKSPQT